MNCRRSGGAAAFAACVSLLACGSTERSAGTSPEGVGESVKQPLLSVPSPIDRTTRNSTWTGSSYELLLADAMAACMLPSGMTGTSATPGRVFGANIQDRVFDRIQALMDPTLAKYLELKGDGLRMAWWLRVRNEPANNGLPISNKNQAMGLAGAFPAAYVLSETSGDADVEALREALEVAGVNFCLARTLKEQSGLGSTFLMTKVEQRQLFQTIRERAQIAMLQLSNLFRALALAQGASTATMDPAVRAALLRKGGFSDGQLTQYAKDLSDLILWEIELTEKLSGQLMRSASAHDPLPGQAALPRDGLEAGSWRQRVLALLYGGDPLAAGDPGARPLSKAVLADDETVSSMLRWPNAAEAPVSAPNLWTSQAIRFRAYLERFDTFSLVLKSNAAYQSPSDIDETQSAIWLYRELEAKLRQRACPPSAREVVPTSQPWCGALDPSAIAESIEVSSTAAPSPNLLAYQMHGFKPSDALQLVKAVIDIMPSLSGTNGFFIEGSVRQTALPGRPNAALVFTKPHFSSRSVLELAAMLGSRGRHRVPALVDASAASAIRAVAPLLSGKATAAAVPLDEISALGAVPALAAAREALAGSVLPQYLGTSPNPVSLIDAAIGKQQVSIRPVERTVYAGGTNNVLQVRDPAENPLWKVSVTTDPADSFWSGSLGQYAIYAAVDYPAILHRLADPTSEKLGLRTLDDLTTRGLDSRLLLVRPQKSGAVLSGSVYLPTKKPVVFFARRTQVQAGVTRYSYMPLTGSVRLWADWRAGIKGLGLPLDSQYYAVGGSLSRIAVSAIAVMPWDLSEPAVDAFDRPRGFVPALQIDPAASQESLLAYRDRVILDAKGKAEALRAQNGSVKLVLDHLRDGLLDQIDVNLERRRELDTTNRLLSSACGSSSVDPSDAGNPCNAESRTFSALGSTEVDLQAICGAVAGKVEPITFDWQVAANCDFADAVTQGPPQSEKRARCLMDRITRQAGADVELAKPVGCSQYLASPPNYGDGSVAAAFLNQHQALAAFRSRVKELRAEGQALVSAGTELDNKFAIAEQQAAILKEKQSNEKLAAFNHLLSLNAAYNEAETQYTGACKYLAELTDTSLKNIGKEGFDGWELLKAGAKGAIAGGLNSWALKVAAGATLGSLVPGLGTAVGAVAGGLVAIGTALFGPSEEELTEANNRVENAKVQRDNAKDAVLREIKLIGECPQEINALYPGVCPCVSQPAQTCTPEPGTMAALQALESQLQKLLTDDARLSANAAYAAGAARLEERISAVQQAAFELAKTNMGIKNDILDLHLAIQKARFEAEQVAHRAGDRFAVGQIFYGNEMNVANGELETARRAALDARRAVEYTMLLNLSKIDQGNDRVGPPSQWADQVYDADLSELRIVGLSQDPMNSEVLSDAKLPHFVSNLEAFVQGFPGSGRIIAIQNNAGRAFVLSAPLPASAASDGSSWFLECPAGSTCAPEGGWCPARTSLANVCLSTANAPLLPKRLKVAYSLNSRGELGQAASAPSVNSRWYRTLINTGVGSVIPDVNGTPRPTSLKNCALARAYLRQQCIQYSGELKYSVQHEAPFIALDADGRWQVLSLQDGYKSSGSSAATTQLIDPQISGNTLDSTGRYAAFVNYQSKGFPLEGWYELTLEAQTDDGSATGQIITDLTALPWVKVLFDSTYWNVQ